MDARRDDDQAVSLVGWLKFPGRAGGGGAFKLTNDKSMYRQLASLGRSSSTFDLLHAGGAIANLASAFHVLVIAQRSRG
jgi:hypothetical protein